MGDCDRAGVLASREANQLGFNHAGRVGAAGRSAFCTRIACGDVSEGAGDVLTDELTGSVDA